MVSQFIQRQEEVEGGERGGGERPGNLGMESKLGKKGMKKGPVNPGSTDKLANQPTNTTNSCFLEGKVTWLYFC
jgi:hypothetical protein